MLALRLASDVQLKSNVASPFYSLFDHLWLLLLSLLLLLSFSSTVLLLFFGFSLKQNAQSTHFFVFEPNKIPVVTNFSLFSFPHFQETGCYNSRRYFNLTSQIISLGTSVHVQSFGWISISTVEGVHYGTILSVLSRVFLLEGYHQCSGRL